MWRYPLQKVESLINLLKNSTSIAMLVNSMGFEVLEIWFLQFRASKIMLSDRPKARKQTTVPLSTRYTSQRSPLSPFHNVFYMRIPQAGQYFVVYVGIRSQLWTALRGVVSELVIRPPASVECCLAG